MNSVSTKDCNCKFLINFLRLVFDLNRIFNFSAEKMISGMYMGELVRLALVKFTKAGLLFGGQGSDLLFKRFQFFTKYVSEIESDKPGTFMNCYDVLEEIGIAHATDEDCANVRFICECVSSRAAYLSSAGIAGLINKMNDPSVTVSSEQSLN